MFQLQPNPTFWATVSIPVPGEKKTPTIEVEFRHKAKSQLDLLIKSEQPLNTAMAEIVNNWKGVSDKFSQDNLVALLDNYPSAAGVIFEVYINALLKGKEKNS